MFEQLDDLKRAGKKSWKEQLTEGTNHPGGFSPFCWSPRLCVGGTVGREEVGSRKPSYTLLYRLFSSCFS